MRRRTDHVAGGRTVMRSQPDARSGSAQVIGRDRDQCRAGRAPGCDSAGRVHSWLAGVTHAAGQTCRGRDPGLRQHVPPRRGWTWRREPIEPVCASTVLAATHRVLSRRSPDEPPEVVDEVRLICVSELSGQIGPVDDVPLFDASGRFLDAVQPDHPFRAGPDIGSEQTLQRSWPDAEDA